VDQSGNFVSLAGFEDIKGALIIDAEVVTARAPDAGHGSGVENGIDAVAGGEDELGIADIALNELTAGGCDSGVVFAAEDADSVSLISELFDDVETEKASTTGNEHTHGFAGGLHRLFLGVGIIFLSAGFGKCLKTLEIFGW